MFAFAFAFPVLASSAQSISCQSYCASKFGSESVGYIDGTAPICFGDCSGCHDGDVCGPRSSDFSDGGHECLTGSKQCCCAQTSEGHVTSTMPDDLRVQTAASAPSCDAFCTSTYGSESIGYVMGDAPFCSGHVYDCRDGDVAGPSSAEFSDGGHACTTGSKQCCCTQTSTMPVLEVQTAEDAPSCDDFCTSHGIKYGYVRGTAPLCGAGPDDCCAHDLPGMRASEFSDGGAACTTGSKQCCCGTPAGQSDCPQPGTADLSCNVIGGLCKAIASKGISSVVGCAGLAGEGAALCEGVGLGPLDAWADACALVVAGAIEIGCTKAINDIGKFGADECMSAAGCSVSSSNQAFQTLPIVA